MLSNVLVSMAKWPNWVIETSTLNIGQQPTDVAGCHHKDTKTPRKPGSRIFVCQFLAVSVPLWWQPGDIGGWWHSVCPPYRRRHAFARAVASPVAKRRLRMWSSWQLVSKEIIPNGPLPYAQPSIPDSADTRSAATLPQQPRWVMITLSVSERFRGSSDISIVIRTDPSDCGYPFEVGHEYLVFAREFQGATRVPG